MNTTKTFDGQTASFIAAIANCLPRTLTGERMQQLIENQEEDLKPLLDCLVRRDLLVRRIDVLLKEVQDFDPLDFYFEREDLLVAGELTTEIHSKAMLVKKLPATTLKVFDLTRDARDNEIIDNLLPGYEWAVDEALARIASMVKAQPKGTKGDLLNDDRYNMFYVPMGVLLVRRYDRYGQWFVGLCRKAPEGWCLGSRIFTR